MKNNDRVYWLSWLGAFFFVLWLYRSGWLATVANVLLNWKGR